MYDGTLYTTVSRCSVQYVCRHTLYCYVSRYSLEYVWRHTLYCYVWRYSLEYVWRHTLYCCLTIFCAVCMTAHVILLCLTIFSRVCMTAHFILLSHYILCSMYDGTLYTAVSLYSVQYAWRHTLWRCEMKLNSITTFRGDRYFVFQLNYAAGTQIITLSNQPMKHKFHSIICCSPFLTSALDRVVTAKLWPLYAWEEAPLPITRYTERTAGGATETVITYCLYVRPT